MQEIKLKRHPDTGELIEEEWKEVPGYDGAYEVSNYGRIRSWKCYSGNIKDKKEYDPHILTPRNDGRYLHVCLYNSNAKQRNCTVHRLVAKLFVNNPLNKPQVNHLDGIKLNNFYLNLEWCTAGENLKHAYKNGLNTRPVGERVGASKLKSIEVKRIRRLYKTGEYLQRELSDMFGVRQDTISRIVNRELWTHI